MEITRAELELMQCALTDWRPQRLVLASESCLPVMPLDAASDALFADQRSWVKARSTPNNGYSNQLQFEPLVRAGVPSDVIWKADQWVMLTRWVRWGRLEDSQPRSEVGILLAAWKQTPRGGHFGAAADVQGGALAPLQ